MSRITLSGNASGTGNFTLASPNSNTDRTLTLPDATGTVLSAPAGAVTINSSAPSNALTLDGSGNLGLGVTPSAWVTTTTSRGMQFGRGGSIFYSTDQAMSNLGTNSYQDGVSTFRYISNGRAVRYSQSDFDGLHRWFNAPSGTAGNAITFTQAMTLDASGNLLVGATSFAGPDGKVSIQYTGGTDYAIKIKTTVASGAAVRFTNPSDGEVGTISQTNTATAYNTSSDYRLKENVQPMSGASERLMDLKPVNFAWKVDGSRVDGFLAHEAQAVVPEAVTGEKDDVDADGNPQYQGIDQSKLVPLLTAALQEALTEIASMKARITALEAN
jgi:hypothetical protein